MLYPVDFRHREVVRHRLLLCEALHQVAVSCHRLFEGVDHPGADKVLRRSHIVHIKPERLLENMPLGLPIPLGHPNELFVELSVNLGCEFLSRSRWHGKINQDKY